MSKYLETKEGSLEAAVLEAVSRAQQAAIAISKKERGEKPKNECASEDEFKPHMMYDPKTGKSVKANTYADHVKYDKMGYTHEKPKGMKEGFSEEEVRELCHSKDHNCAIIVNHPEWGLGKPVYESHAIPTDDGYVEWYDVEFKHGIEREVPAEDMEIIEETSHMKSNKHKDDKKMISGQLVGGQKKLDKDKDGDIDGKDFAMLRKSKKNESKEVKMAIGIASDPRYKGGNMTGAVKAIEKMKKGLSKHPQVRAVLRRQNEETDHYKEMEKIQEQQRQSMRQALAQVWGVDEGKNPFKKDDEKVRKGEKTETGEPMNPVSVNPKMDERA